MAVKKIINFCSMTSICPNAETQIRTIRLSTLQICINWLQKAIEYPIVMAVTVTIYRNVTVSLFKMPRIQGICYYLWGRFMAYPLIYCTVLCFNCMSRILLARITDNLDNVVSGMLITSMNYYNCDNLLE